MGEYAKYKGSEIKIGTCEDMLYLRADQAHKVTAVRDSVDPVRQAEHIRFRFPFPQEDGKEPGSFEPFYTLGVHVDPPEDIEHGSIQFSRTYPQSGGILLSVPCPRGARGKTGGVTVHYNGYSGGVQIAQQRLLDGQLKLVCQCGDCGAAYRCDTIEDAQPIIDALLKTADYRDHETRIANERPGAMPCSSSGGFYREVAKRIVDGYSAPNPWTREAVAA